MQCRRIEAWPAGEACIFLCEGDGFAEVASVDPGSACEDATVSDPHYRTCPDQKGDGDDTDPGAYGERNRGVDWRED